MKEKVSNQMNVLNLIIKQKYFDLIMRGQKVQEFREVRPTTIKKLLQLDEEGYEVTDEHGNAQPIKYDAIRFYVGYNKERDSALVEVKDAYCEIFTHDIDVLADENGNIIYFKVDEDGKFLLDEKENLIPCESESENGKYVYASEGQNAVTINVPIEYEYKGELWYAEQVVYNLGKILESDIKPKKQA